MSLFYTSSTVYDLIHSISTCRDTHVWFWWNWKCEMKHFISSWCPQLSSVQLLSHVPLFLTPWTAACSSPSPTPGAYSNSCSSSCWCHPTISSSVIPFSSHLQTFPASGPFQWVNSSNQVAKVLEFQLQHPSNEYSGLIFFRVDWLDLLAVQGMLKSLLQHHSSEASSLLCSAFFIVHHSHAYMATRKTIALTRWTFVG